MTTERMTVVCAADERFARPLAVTLYSLVVTCASPLGLDLYVIDGGIERRSRERIERVLGRAGARLAWLSPEVGRVSHLVASVQYPTSVYLRLLLPDLLPPTIEKVIYLDSDLVVQEDVSQLWTESVDGHALLAVRDEGCPTVAAPLALPNFRELGLDPRTPYFNSGVLVMNLKYWRAQHVAEQVLDYVAHCPYVMRFGEQDALNAVLATRWRQLSPKWNQLVTPWEGNDGRSYRGGILHFVSAYKPWLPIGAHWTNAIFDARLRESQWHGRLGWARHHWPLALRRRLVMYLRDCERRARRRDAATAQSAARGVDAPGGVPAARALTHATAVHHEPAPAAASPVAGSRR